MNEERKMKLRVHLVGDEVNEVHHYRAKDVETAEKWAKAFKKLFEDAIKDQADMDIIVIRGVPIEKDHSLKPLLYV